MASRPWTARREFPNPGFDGLQQEVAGPRPRLHQFRCCGCGYGASCAAAPERCPMCSGSVWDYVAGAAAWSAAHELDALAPLSRDGRGRAGVPPGEELR